MPKYIYKAKSSPQEVLNGQLEANSKEDAASKLAEMGLIAIEIVEKDKVYNNLLAEDKDNIKENKTEFSYISGQAITVFIKQLSSLISARVPILKALSLLKDQTKNKAFKNIIDDIYQQVKNGKMLSEAMGRYPKYFNNFCLNIISCGEKGGVLDKVLYNLAQHRQKTEDLKRQIQAALAYPLFILVTGAITVFVMLTFFLPKLLKIFKDMHQALPWPTQILIFVSDIFSHYWYWLVIFIFFLIAIFIRYKQSNKDKFIFDKFQLKIPFVRKIILYSDIVKFTYTLGILLKYGMSIHKSLPLVNNVLGNNIIKKQLDIVTEDIMTKGMTLSNSLKNINLFPPFVINMISVGEEGGNLKDSLAEVADFYERELNQIMKIFASLLEPILILTVGAIVGFIVFAMLLPIFNVSMMTQ